MSNHRLHSSFTSLAAFLLLVSSHAACAGTAADPSLQEPRFRPLQLGQVRAAGWLRQQLRIQADGLSGHLDEFWPDIKDSAWIGGKAEGWERMPYWLDGVVALAYTLDDQALKEKAGRHVTAILDRQQKDGWLGPVPPDMARHDIWALFLALKVLVQYTDATGDARAADAIERALRRIDLHIDASPLFNWGQFRWFEALIPIYWLHERTGQKWLVDLAVKLQAQGFDYTSFFRRWPLTTRTQGRWNYIGHVVNNTMAVKSGALWWRLTGEDADRQAVYDMIGKLTRYHGMPTGVVTGDECLAGTDPTQGTELCSVVEYMFSLENVAGILGDPLMADLLEKITFNALPATFSPDMWSHQYDQQVNQVECSVREGRKWTNNGPESNIFGLEPHFGCCTSNLSQGWPKFAAHLWMRSEDGGLAAMCYAPCVVETQCAGSSVSLNVVTDYPFRDKVRIAVTVNKPARFPIFLRIPQWCGEAAVEVNGKSEPGAKPGSFMRIEREWSGTAEIALQLPMAVRAARHYRNAMTLERGPLVFSLPIPESWRRIHADKPGRELPHGDWEVHPTGPWNYALCVNEKSPQADAKVSEREVGALPFSPEGAPVRMHVRGVLVPSWTSVNGSAGDVPDEPVAVQGNPAELTLIPYGCTNLRITEFPVAQ